MASALALEGSSASAIPEPRTEAPVAARRVLAADVSAFSLAEILGWIHSAGKSGFLDFGFRDHEKAVFFREGEVVFARSNQRVDRLGECLLRAGVISLAQLRAAEQRFEPPGRFGKVFVEQGFLTPRELWQGVKDQVEEIVRSLFAYSSGVVHFFDGDVQPDNVVRLSLPTHRLVAEGVQRREELRRFLAALEDPRVRVVTVDGTSEPLSGEERTLFDALDQEPSFPAVCRALALEPLAAARGVQLLRLVGAVKLIRGPGEASEAGAAPVRPENLERKARLIAELGAPLVAVGGVEAIRGRAARILEDLADRIPELEGVEFGPALALDAERILARADSEEAAGRLEEALDELAAYLEFELKNHPGIENADFILEPLASLRP